MFNIDKNVQGTDSYRVTQVRLNSSTIAGNKKITPQKILPDALLKIV